ncbi:zinc metalloproteinase nas-36-like [Gigantopelta aegis]|uniref:zinc metalloproteinase nas-36-like n=1 Tax=Gigantopelta aegis TaxID=1735272 RepID=UPI001B888240|nr:zinc metalloproteinase nas-36-like [Gigantopelta aegis]
MKYLVVILFVLGCCPRINSSADESFDENDNENELFREERAIPILSEAGKKIVGKLFKFANLTKVSGGVTLTLNKKVLNFANLRIDKTTALSLDKYLKDEPLYERLYVFNKLAAIEANITSRQGGKLKAVAIEDLVDTDDDIVLDKEDVDEIWQQIQIEPELLDLSPKLTVLKPKINPTLERVKRKVTSKSSRKWSSLVIPWKYSSSFSTSYKNVIESAIQHWEAETCLDFRKNACSIFKCIRFKKNSGCYSKIGKRLFGQTISIGTGCNTKGIVAHEIGHALGFWHEQSRPDRDRYIWINSANIKTGRKHNFIRRSWKEVFSLGVPYDYSSVMHYGSKAFSKNSGNTITTKESRMLKTIGSRHELSFYDIKLANLHYCNSKCSGGLKSSMCRNDGYKNPKNCAVCKCPDGWSGKYCTGVKPSVHANCGTAKLTASSSWKYMSSPKYTTSGYPGNSECTWLIQAPWGKRVIMRFVSTFTIRCHSTNCKDYVEVRYTDLARTGERYCCSSRPTQYFRSHGNKIMILLRVRGSSSYRGFKIQYKLEGCGGCSYGAPSVEPVCYETQRYSCPGKYKKSCGFLGLGRCTRYRTNTCYKKISKCCSNYKRIGSNCYRYLSKWSSWSSCSAACGACGTRKRTRTCIKPPCNVSLVQTVRCNRKLCPGYVGTMTKKCSYKSKCGWWFLKKTCTKYKTCTVKSRCCTGFKPSGSYCY